MKPDHGPIDARVRETANNIGKIIGGVLPEDMGFALLIFDRGSGGRMNYISNAKREEMIAALHELLANFEGRNTGEEGRA